MENLDKYTLVWLGFMREALGVWSYEEHILISYEASRCTILHLVD